MKTGTGNVLPLWRKLLYTLIMLAAFLGALEGLARLLEPRYFPYVRSIPLPMPGEARDKIRALTQLEPDIPQEVLNSLPDTLDRSAGQQTVPDTSPAMETAVPGQPPSMGPPEGASRDLPRLDPRLARPPLPPPSGALPPPGVDPSGTAAGRPLPGPNLTAPPPPVQNPGNTMAEHVPLGPPPPGLVQGGRNRAAPIPADASSQAGPNGFAPRPPGESGPIGLQADPRAGWRLAQGAPPRSPVRRVGSNSLGLRGPELPPREKGELRLMTLGDSSIFGDGVPYESVFSTVAAQNLAKAWNRKVTGVIGAVPGHDSGQSLEILRPVGKEVQPTWLLIGSLWSDIYRAGNGDPREQTYLPPVRQWLRKYALYRIVWQLMSPVLQRKRVGWLLSKDDVPELGVEGSNPRKNLREYAANLREMVEEARRLKAYTLFLMLPAPMDQDRLPPPLTVQAYREAMRTVARDTGSTLIDGPALFKSKGANLRYFYDQVHPSREGHRLLALGVVQALEKLGAPPPGQSHYPVQAFAAPARP